MVERLLAKGRIPNAIRKAKKRAVSFSRIAAGITAVRRWADSSRFQRKRTAGKDKQHDKETAAVRQLGH
jgi:hypothetical protein